MKKLFLMGLSCTTQAQLTVRKVYTYNSYKDYINNRKAKERNVFIDSVVTKKD